MCEHVSCPRCNRVRHLARLPRNFQCADVICKFCGYLAQVKALTLPDGTDRLPDRVLGAAWGPQHDQITAGIFHGLFLVGYRAPHELRFIDYIPAHILEASPAVFEPRNPLSDTARRAGWRGFYYNLAKIPAIGIRRVHPRPD